MAVIARPPLGSILIGSSSSVDENTIAAAHGGRMTEGVRVMMAVGMGAFWLGLLLLAVWALSRLRIH